MFTKCKNFNFLFENSKSYLVTCALVDWVALCECVDIDPARDQETHSTWVVVVEVHVVEGTVDIFSGSHASSDVTCLVDDDLIVWIKVWGGVRWQCKMNTQLIVVIICRRLLL